MSYNVEEDVHQWVNTFLIDVLIFRATLKSRFCVKELGGHITNVPYNCSVEYFLDNVSLSIDLYLWWYWKDNLGILLRFYLRYISKVRRFFQHFLNLKWTIFNSKDTCNLLFNETFRGKVIDLTLQYSVMNVYGVTH